MRKRNLLADDDAVSPVIGVILMVAITVILAAVIASFVLGLGDQPQQTPQIDFEFDYDGDNLEVTHNGGGTISSDEIELRGTAEGDDEGDVENEIGQKFHDYMEGDVEGPSDISTGDTATINVGSEYDITVTWVPPGGGSTSPLASDEGSA